MRKFSINHREYGKDREHISMDNNQMYLQIQTDNIFSLLFLVQLAIHPI
jgi:hypothetical protein